MSDGLFLDPSGAKLSITKDGRTVFTSDGTLVCLLPTPAVSIDNQTLTFADFAKDNAYIWTWSVKHVPLSDPDKYQKGESCACFITATPQESFVKTVIGDVPAGADFFVGRVRLDRTTAPLNTWQGRTLAVLPIQTQWIPIMGSVVMEADYGMARAMHLYIDDDPLSATYRKLILAAQQSVGPPPGGWDTGFSYGALGSISHASGGAVVNGGNTASGARNGTPVFLRDQDSYGYTAASASFTAPQLMRWTGSQACARTDTTNYKSVYAVDIQGRFGRRS